MSPLSLDLEEFLLWGITDRLYHPEEDTSLWTAHSGSWASQTLCMASPYLLSTAQSTAAQVRCQARKSCSLLYLPPQVVDLGHIYTAPSRFPTKLAKVFWKLYTSQRFCWLAFSLTAQQTPWPVWHWVKIFHIFRFRLHPRINTLISHMQELEHREIK